MRPAIVIFTDLDGSLLHPSTYSFAAAEPALRVIARRSIPLVLCSSKTRAEIEVYRGRLGNDHPFIAENGGGVFIPPGYFPVLPDGIDQGGYRVHVLGRPYREIRAIFADLRGSLGAAVRGFGDLSSGEIAALTGLSPEEAVLAREREFDEPFVFSGEPDPAFLQAVEARGLRWTRGLIYHVMGNSDKGRAVRLLKSWYGRKYGTIISIGLGDGLNDGPLLQEVEHPVLIRKANGGHEQGVDVPGLIRTEGIGPAGWNEAVLSLLDRIG